jgi:hypothetical protein
MTAILGSEPDGTATTRIIQTNHSLQPKQTFCNPFKIIGAPDRVNLGHRIQRDRMSNPLKVVIDFIETMQLLSNLNLRNTIVDERSVAIKQSD